MGDLTRASFRFLIGSNASFYAWLLRRGVRLSSDTLAFVYTFPPLWVMSGLSPARICPCWAHNAPTGMLGRFCALSAGISVEIRLHLSREELSGKTRDLPDGDAGATLIQHGRIYGRMLPEGGVHLRKRSCSITGARSISLRDPRLCEDNIPLQQYSTPVRSRATNQGLWLCQR